MTALRGFRSFKMFQSFKTFNKDNSPQRHSPCGIAARYSTGQEFAEVGVFFNQKLFTPRHQRLTAPPGTPRNMLPLPSRPLSGDCSQGPSPFDFDEENLIF